MNWIINNNKLEKTFRLASFSAIIKALNEIDLIATQHNHHPDFSVFGYCNISFSLTTHDAGNNISDKDYELAKAIDHILVSKS